MNNYEKLYWLTRLDSINGLFICLGICSAMIIFVYYLIKLVDFDWDEDSEKQWKFIPRLSFPILIVSCLISTFLPNKNEAILIMAGGKTLDFAQKDTSLSKLPAQTTELISKLMEKEITSLKK